MIELSEELGKYTLGKLISLYDLNKISFTQFLKELELRTKKNQKVQKKK